MTSANIKAKVEGYNHDGRGIAHIDGKVIFIDGALPNEEVIFAYTKRHRKYDEGIIVEIIEASPDRTTPQCPHTTICGGCSQQHIKHHLQLELKQKTLLEQLHHFGNIIPENILPPLTGPLFGYRHKARLSVKYVSKKNKVVVGFHEKNGRYIADIETCTILHTSIGSLIKPLSELIGSLRSYQHIPQIEIAVGNEATALIFRNLESLCPEDEYQIKNFAQQYDFYIYLQPSTNESSYLLYPEQTSPYLSYLLPQDIKIYFLPTDFTQINYAINKQMVDLAIQLLEPNHHDHILDLFCGLGNFTLPIARQCASISGIEGNQAMINRAKNNATLNNINNAEFYCADLSQPLNLDLKYNQYTKILLDPPRTGALEIANQINCFNPQRIVYISCNPATLARDSGILRTAGYTLKTLRIVDMFPHTKHVEAIALFVPKST
jgi:23S rRNA (uracil1939-C5)-methyltransferase